MVRKRRFDDPEEEDAKFSVVTDIDPSGPELTEDCLNEELPIMTLRNMVMFPSVIMPITVGRRSTLKLTKAALKGNKPIVIATQKVMEVEDPNLNDLYTTAVVGRVLREFELPGGNTTVILQASTLKVRIDSVTSAKPYLKGKVSALPEDMEMKENNDELDALLDTAKDLCSKYIEVSENGAQEMVFALKNLPQNHMMINYVCTNFPFPIEDKINMLAKSTLKDRLYTLIQVLNKQTKLALIKQDIQLRTREDLDKQQKEYFLQQQIKNIQDELGTGQDEEVENLRDKAAKKQWNEEVGKIFDRELAKLERLNPQSPDYNVQLSYLQVLLSLPWNVYSQDSLNIQNAEKVLNKDHYGLEKVKERILEHLAVLKLKGDMKSPIICLYGPPGVGKTSLGRSIATSLKRKYIRMSLGGVHDEAEIRGHRKTYIGAMPGRIIKSLIKAETSNPVII